MTQRDIKLIWGRAASRCSICKTKLAEVGTVENGLIIGEQAHIVGEQDSAARGISNLTIEERNSYSNLILLCPNHHTLIDKDVETYTVEKLHYIKSEHELWVEEKLATHNNTKELAKEIVYTHIIDSALEMCYLQSYDNWITALCSPSMYMLQELYNELSSFCTMIFKAIFPGSNIELERAIRTFSRIIKDLLTTYGLHIRSDGKYFASDRFYANSGTFNPHYHSDLEKYELWENRVTTICFELTKSINWLSEIIRRDINPLFFIKEGKFTLSIGPDEELKYAQYCVEFTDDEKSNLPDAYLISDLSLYK